MKRLLIIMMCLLFIPIAYAGTVTRSFNPANPSPGDTVTVTLTIDADAGDKAILIHEEAPFTIIGLTDNVYETALIDQLQVADTTKVYTFVAGSEGTYVAHGLYAINGGADITIAGPGTIDVGTGGQTTSTQATTTQGVTTTQAPGPTTAPGTPTDSKALFWIIGFAVAIFLMRAL